MFWCFTVTLFRFANGFSEVCHQKEYSDLRIWRASPGIVFRCSLEGFSVLLVHLRSDLGKFKCFSHISGRNQFGGDWVNRLRGQVIRIFRYWLSSPEILKESYCRSAGDLRDSRRSQCIKQNLEIGGLWEDLRLQRISFLVGAIMVSILEIIAGLRDGCSGIFGCNGVLDSYLNKNEIASGFTECLCLSSVEIVKQGHSAFLMLGDRFKVSHHWVRFMMVKDWEMVNRVIVGFLGICFVTLRVPLRPGIKIFIFFLFWQLLEYKWRLRGSIYAYLSLYFSAHINYFGICGGYLDSCEESFMRLGLLVAWVNMFQRSLWDKASVEKTSEAFLFQKLISFWEISEVLQGGLSGCLGELFGDCDRPVTTLFLSQHLWRNLQSLGLLWDTFGDSFWCFSSFWFLRIQARVMVSIMSNGSIRNYRPFRILKNWNFVVYKRRTQLPTKPQLSSSSLFNKFSSSFGFIFGFFAKVSLGVSSVFVLLEMSQSSLLGKESVEKSLGAVALSFWVQFTLYFGFNIVATLDPIGYNSYISPRSGSKLFKHLV